MRLDPKSSPMESDPRTIAIAGATGFVGRHVVPRLLEEPDLVLRCLDAAFLENGDSTVTAANWYGARMNPLKIDHKIKAKEETFRVGEGKLTAYHCPGHSPGSVVYFTQIDSNRVLFGQDVHGPLETSFLSNREKYIRSLQFMKGLNADVLCEGHFGVYQGNDRVSRFIQSYL